MWAIEEGLKIKVAVIGIEGIKVTQEEGAFDRLRECASSYRQRFQNTSIGDVEGVQIARSLFRALGIDPTKHRPASEALLKRALKSKEFYSINALVDVANWCALDFLLPTCVYDADKIIGQVVIRRGKDGESYLGLNSRPVNVFHRFTVADDQGPFGSPMTDSQRTAITFSTARAILDIYAPSDYDSDLLRQKAQTFARRTIEFCGGSLNNIQIVGVFET